MNVTFNNPGFEHSVESIMLFQEDGAAPYWSDALSLFYPQIDKKEMAGLAPDGKKAYVIARLKNVWDELTDELDRKVVSYNAHFNKYHAQMEDALSDAFELDTRTVFNDLSGCICLNPICPRFLEKRYFDVFYKNSERGALGMAAHEMIHFIWFYVWNRHFGDGYSEYDAPSLKWILSEMVVESIMSDERLASVNPYYPRENGGCVYSYFLDMVIQGEPILDTLMRMYQGNRITDFMEISYSYCLENETAIRRHISEAEN